MPAIYMPMLQTAEVVAERYGVSRESQDEFALHLQQRTAAAQAAGRFDQEIVALPRVRRLSTRRLGEVSEQPVSLTRMRATGPRRLSTVCPSSSRCWN